MKEKQVIRYLPDGTPLYDFDPADEYPDSVEVNEDASFRRRMRSTKLSFAEAAREHKSDVTKVRAQYQEFVPCVRCRNCTIVRVKERGEFRNRIYSCAILKCLVSRCGTCTYAGEGKNGPNVIEIDRTMDEILANKNALIN